ncbi:CRISPR-associated endonuclease Cas1 [Fuerstiella marisgermanici]|uniref:CRISPR-associated endonuclease Cas1 n=2 Tax=Fuerstiella marisgermanici TaxID=1891926 RepID=A0A1P8WMH3_9PLAN|nr:CRISPR-associated endonuclease Cas1 [Fuerstiella marisgermanici]
MVSVRHGWPFVTFEGPPMRNRILEISESPCRLRVEHQQLVVDRGTEEDGLFPTKIPLEDIAAVVVAHPQVSYTQSVLSELSERGAAFVTCNRNRMPVGILLPLNANSVQTERFRRQLELKLPQKKRLWQQIVKSKIDMQAQLLQEVHGETFGLPPLIPLVRSGDTTNVEARAARRYWTALFGKDFRRDIDAENQNRFLNYGYAILRAATARAICAAGLHPSLGLHHHNKYNAWCLADDVMEPFRPVVDKVVVHMVNEDGADAEFNQQRRAILIRCLLSRVFVHDQQRTVLDALSLVAASLVDALSGSEATLSLPQEFAHAA